MLPWSTPEQEKLKTFLHENASKTPDSTQEDSSMLALVIKQYATAALTFTEKLCSPPEAVTNLRAELAKQPRIAPIATSSSITMTGEEMKATIDDKVKTKDLSETLYLMSRIQVETYRKINLNDSLSMAAEHGWFFIVRALKELGAKPEIQDDKARTAITYAAIGGEWNTFEHLLEEGCYPNFMDRDGRSPLSYASERGFIRIVRRLLGDARVSADLRDRNDCTPLSYAVEGGYEPVVRLLVETGKVDLDFEDKSGGTPLLLAVSSGQEAIVKLLLDSGANANEKDKDYGEALDKASWGGHEAVVKLLLDSGADAKVRQILQQGALGSIEGRPQGGGEAAARIRCRRQYTSPGLRLHALDGIRGRPQGGDKAANRLWRRRQRHGQIWILQ